MNHLKHSLNPDYTTDRFKMEEIQWDHHYPADPELIPFENSTKKIIEALEQEKAQADNKLNNN